MRRRWGQGGRILGVEIVNGLEAVMGEKSKVQ